MAKDNVLPALRQSRRSLSGCSSRRLQSPPLHFGDGSRFALMPSILDKAFKGEL